MPAATNQTTVPTARPDTRPDPDPTVRTSEQLLREISLVREIVDSQVSGVRLVFETRLNGMDKAIELLQVRSDQIPTNISCAVAQLKALHDEKFSSINTQLVEKDKRIDQTSRDNNVAVQAAFSAAKEAVGEQNKSNALAISKSEATFTKQIDQTGTVLSTMQKNNDDKFSDLKDRLAAVEVRLTAAEGQRKGIGDAWGVIVAIVGLVFGALGVASRFIR